MRKRVLVFLMAMACVLNLTACGETEDYSNGNVYLTSVEAVQNADELVMAIGQIAMQYAGNIDEYKDALTKQAAASYDETSMEYAEVINAGVESYSNALEELGSNATIVTGSETVTVDEEEIVVQIAVQGDATAPDGSPRTATAEVIFEKAMPTSIAVTIDYSFGELMKTAALNMVLGMGTVFAILLIIMFFISILGLVPKLMDRKKEEKKTLEAAVDNTISNIIAKEENATDDLELVAVITAAIAASEGTSSDGFVVRSIIRR
ncbi:MAG: OadG family protein [Lachnospiraceae bacterium]|nr:OadG family protein [Lachnospiraceae bacterium]